MIVSVNTDEDKGPLHCWFEFHSADEFINQSCDGKNSDGWNYFDGFDDKEFDEFYECSGRIQARDLAEHGFPQGREAVAKLKAKIEGRIGRRSRSFQATYDVTGSSVDVGVYLSGEPECMLSFEECDSTEEQFVDIHFSSGVSGGIDTDSMVLNGAAVCALVDALEDNGKRVRLTWERSSSVESPSSKKTFPTVSVWVLLKDHQDTLDLDRIAFFCTSPVTRRAMAWSIDTQCPMSLVREMGLTKTKGIMTFPANNPKYRDNCDVYVPAMIASTEEGAAEWVLGELKRLGVEITQDS